MNSLKTYTFYPKCKFWVFRRTRWKIAVRENKQILFFFHRKKMETFCSHNTVLNTTYKCLNRLKFLGCNFYIYKFTVSKIALFMTKKKFSSKKKLFFSLSFTCQNIFVYHVTFFSHVTNIFSKQFL